MEAQQKGEFVGELPQHRSLGFPPAGWNSVDIGLVDRSSRGLQGWESFESFAADPTTKRRVRERNGARTGDVPAAGRAINAQPEEARSLISGLAAEASQRTSSADHLARRSLGLVVDSAAPFSSPRVGYVSDESLTLLSICVP
jgi:hypothetical protein